MKLRFTLHDALEISSSASAAFISTFHYQWDESNSDFVPDDSDSELIKETVSTAIEETQCAGLKFFKDITPGEDRSLIATCREISFWCCCETIKKVSPMIAEATTNLRFYN